ncbi:MAG: AEC family transporter [Bauldia sp.]
MSDIVRLVLPVFGLIFLGFGAARLRSIPDEGVTGLNLFVYYLALPALFFQTVSQTPIAEMAGWSYVLTTTFSTYCAFAIAFSIGALINGGNVGEATVQGLVGSHANIGSMAPALAIGAFETVAATPMALIFSFDYAMLLTLTPLMMVLAGTVRTSPAAIAATIARQVLLHPLIIATALGLAAAAGGLRLSDPFDALLTLLRNAAAPCALFALGVGLSRRPVGRLTTEMPFLIAVKLVGQPLIVYLLLSWVGGFDPVWVYAAVLMAALPPAENVYDLAKRYNTYAGPASSAIALATVVSIATVTVTLIVLLNRLLPIDPFR